jgi:ABC-type multidrug transport system fused ATPase/permease subunit
MTSDDRPFYLKQKLVRFIFGYAALVLLVTIMLSVIPCIHLVAGEAQHLKFLTLVLVVGALHTKHAYTHIWVSTKGIRGGKSKQSERKSIYSKMTQWAIGTVQNCVWDKMCAFIVIGRPDQQIAT